MSITRYRRTLLTGGVSASLDGIDGADLIDGDICEVFTIADEYYIYRLKAISSGIENSPLIIIPDLNPGSKRWKLQSHILPNLMVNGDFNNWTDGEPDGWSRDHDNTVHCYVTENPSGSCQFIRNLAYEIPLYRYQINLEIGKIYRCTIVISSISSGLIYCCNQNADTYGPELLSLGSNQFTFTAINDNYFEILADAVGAGHTDIIVNSISIEECF